MSQTTPAGWYPDPSNPGQQRYWDGAAWTDAVHQPQMAPTTQVGYGYTMGGGAGASFGARLGAYLLDVLIVAVPGGIVVNILAQISTALFVLGEVALIVGIAYYFGHFEGGPEGQTVGKRVVGIRVVDADSGQPGIGAGRAVGRYFARIISALPCYLGFLWMLWDAQKQTFHDKIVRTRVVKV